MEGYHSLAQLMGSFAAFVVLLELFVFFLISIYKLATTKRLAWFLTCILTGIPIGLMLISFLIAVDVVEWSTSSQISSTSSRRASVSLAEGTIVGDQLPYELHLAQPSSWRVKKDSLGLDFCLNQQGVHLGVLSQKKPFQSMAHLRQYLYDSLQGIGVVYNENCDEGLISIDGREWIHLRAKVDVDGCISMNYALLGYTGEEGTYQIISWEASNFPESAYQKMLEVAQSFQFPRTMQTSTAKQS
ncbi:MAG: hypothetical protein Tsb0018_03620 [Opitutales bacterium]